MSVTNNRYSTLYLCQYYLVNKSIQLHIIYAYTIYEMYQLARKDMESYNNQNKTHKTRKHSMNHQESPFQSNNTKKQDIRIISTSNQYDQTIENINPSTWNSNYKTPVAYTNTKKNNKIKHTQKNINTTSLQSTSSPHILRNNQTLIDNMDLCPFTLALRIDKRTVLQIYWDYLKESLFIIRTFVKQSEFELLSVNLSVLIFGLTLDFTLNALFYTDDIISERYHSKGQLSFWSTILKSMYSCALSFVLVAIVNGLSVYSSELDMLVKEFKYQDVFDIICKKKTASLKLKLVLFFVIEFVLLCCFWYYCTVFCIVYHQSQLSWLEGCGTNFLLSCATTMGICSILTLIRVGTFKYNSSQLYYTARYVSKKI